MILPPHLCTKFSPFSSSSSSSSPNPSKTLPFPNLLKLGLAPSLQSLNLLLSSLLKSRKPLLLFHLFSQLSSNSLQPNSQTLTLAARALLKARRFEEAKQLLSNAQRSNLLPKVRLWDSLIKGLCVVEGDPERALTVLNECVEKDGILPSLHTFRSLVFAFSSLGKMERAIEVVDAMTGENVGYPFDNFVCSSVVSGFCRIGKAEVGLGFYERAEKIHGFRPNLITLTTVIDALCREGRVDEVSDLVRKMESSGMVLDAVMYGSWVCGLFRRGFLMEGLQKHRLMAENGIMPDVVSYTNLVDGLCKVGNVEKVVGIIEEMEKSGKGLNLITYTVLIQGFCKKGKLEEAFCVLRRMEESGVVADEFAYSVLIDGLCRKGDLDRVFSLLEEMEGKGIEVGSVTYNTVINGLCKAGKTSKADETSRAFSGDNFTYTTLLHCYMKEMDVERVIETKRRLEVSGISMDVVTCNVLIKSHFMVGLVEDACVIFQEMTERGVVANNATYCIMIDGFSKLGMIDKALEIFEEYRKSSLLSSSSCHCCIIRGLCKEHMVEVATEVFLDIIDKRLVADSSTYRRLIKAMFKEGEGEGVLKFIHQIRSLEPELLTSICNDVVVFLCRKGCFAAALDEYIIMRRRGLPVTCKSFYVLLKSLIRSGNRLITELLMCDAVKLYGYFEPRISNVLSLYLCKKNVEEAIQFLTITGKKNIYVSVSTAIIDALKNEARVQDAHKFLMEANENGVALDVFVFSIVVDKLCKGGHLEKALDLCALMEKKGIYPNIVVYNSVINGLCQQGCLVEAFRIFDSLEPKGVLPTVITYATLIDALSREGLLQDANQLFKRMVIRGISPITRIYNLLISGHCNFGCLGEALEILKDLERSGLQPDAFTISFLISGYCLKGDMEGALSFFSEYKVKGFSPDFLGFLNLIKGLFTKGRMEEARSILRDMLQCTAAVDLINRAGDELHVESLVSFLELACEQGRIQEVIQVLSEVRFMSFSSWRSDNHKRMTELRKVHENGSLDVDDEMKISSRGGKYPMAWEVSENVSQYVLADMADISDGLCNIGKHDAVLDDTESLSGKSLYSDFGTFYSIIASLCSKGQQQKANSVVKTIFHNSGGNCFS